VALHAHRLLGEGAGHVVVEVDERVLTAGLTTVSPGLLPQGLLEASVGEPIRGSLPRSGDHPRHQDKRVDRKTIGHQRCGEAAERLANDNQIAPVTDGIDHRIDVLAKAGGVVAR
jgi:hypothetical protein